MGKTLKYVSEFSFPSDKGYSGSAGQQMVKGYARGGSCGYAKGGMKPMKKADGGAVDDPRRPMMDRTVKEYIDAINAERAMEKQAREMSLRELSNSDRSAMERAMMDRIRGEFPGGLTANEMRRIMMRDQMPRMAKGGKMDRLKDVIGNERKEMTRVEAKQRDAGQELSRVQSEMRYDKNEMKGMRKQYPVDRREPMVAMKKGGMLFSKKEVSAKNLLREGKAPPLPHAKGSVNMKSGGKVKKAMGGAMDAKPEVSRPSRPAPSPNMPTQQQMQAMAQQQMQSIGLVGRPGGMPPRPNPPGMVTRPGETPSGMVTRPGGLGGVPANRPSLSPAEEAFMRNARSGMSSVNTTTQAPMMTGPKSGQTAPRPVGLPAIRNNPPPATQTAARAAMAKGGMTGKQQVKVGKVMSEFKSGDLRSGSKSGPVVKSRKQAIAIGLSEARKAKK